MYISALKDMHSSIDLKPTAQPTIVAPALQKYDEAIDAIRRALQTRSEIVPVVIREDPQEGSPLPSPVRPSVSDACRTIILIGTLLDSAACRALYGRRYVCADKLYPGPGGWVVRTVHNPYGDGRNYVVATGSDFDGVGVSVQRLAQRIRDVSVMGHFIDVESDFVEMSPPDNLNELVDAAVEDILLNGRPSAAIDPIIGCGYMYHLTGRTGWATAWKNGVEKHLDTIIGETKSKPTGRAEFWTWQIIQQWDLLEEADVFDDSCRLEMTNTLYALSERAAAISYMLRENLPEHQVRWNHQTFNALGCLAGGTYFTMYYQLPEAAGWLDQARLCFEGMRGTVRSWDEAGGYGAITPLHLLLYGFEMGDDDFLNSVDLKGMADRAFLNHDPMGVLVNHGDGGGWSKVHDYAAIGYTAQYWEAMTGLYGDGRYQWMIDHCEAHRLPYHASMDDLRRLSHEYSSPPFATEIRSIEPDDQIGVQVFAPLDAKVYDADSSISPVPFVVPQADTVDKIAFREGLSSISAYLLWDGFGAGRHGHMDSNAIVRLSDNGRVWLADGGYNSESTARYHNALVVIKNGRLEPMPPLCRIEMIATVGSSSAGILNLPHYGGVDWTRMILRRKHRYFLILDSVVIEDEGDFDLRLSWRWLGNVSPTDSGLSVSQKGAGAIQATNQPDGIIRDEERYFVGRYPVWEGYPFADPVVRHFEQRRVTSGSRGDHVSWCSVIASSESAAPAGFRVTENQFGYIIDTPETRAIAGVGSMSISSLSITASAFHLEESGIWTVLGATHFACETLNISSSAPISIELDRNESRISIDASKDVEITQSGDSFNMKGTRHLKKGRHTFRIEQSQKLELPPELFASDSPKDTSRPGPVLATKILPEPQFKVEFDGVPNAIAAIEGIIACGTTAGSVHVFTTDGDESWSVTPGGKVNDIIVLTGSDGSATSIVTAHENRMVHSYSLDGEPQWSYQCPNGELSTVGRARLLRSADTNHDGIDELLIGTASWWVICMTPGGEELWRTRCYAHSCLSLEVGRLDAAEPCIVQSNEYYYLHALSADGAILASRYIDRWAPRVSPVVLVDINGDGRDEIICGGSDGIVRAFCLTDSCGEARGMSQSHNLNELWQVCTGGEITAMSCIDGSGAGSSIVVASEGYQLASIGGTGDKRWEFDIGFPADRIFTAGNGVLAIGNDRIIAASSDGNRRIAWQVPGFITSSAIIASTLVIGVTEGRLFLYDVDTLLCE